jgi:hypothetical protein
MKKFDTYPWNDLITSKHRMLNHPVKINQNNQMNEGRRNLITRKTHLETEMEILYVDVFVWSSFALAPQQETFFGCHFLNGNILDGES